MKTQKILLWLIMAFVVIDFASYFIPALKGMNAGGNGAGVWLFKMGEIACSFTVGWCIFRLRQLYLQHQFFTEKATLYLRWVAYLVIGIAVLGSFEYAFRQLQSIEGLYTGGIPSSVVWPVAVRAFFAHFLVHEPISIFLGLCMLLVTDFVQKAIVVKSENESFI